MSIEVPSLLVGLLDDAAVFPPGSASVADAVVAHRAHRSAWYAPMIGALLVPADDAGDLGAGDAIGLIGELPAIRQALAALPPGRTVRQVESPVAKRGEDPLPGLRALATFAEVQPFQVYAETPLSWGLMSALDQLAALRSAGVPIAAKFRTGGLAAELFPTPVELAAVICACRDRDLPFKLTAGLHHAVRQADPQTGLVHHGFLNVLVAVLAAADGGEPVELAEVLATLDALPLAEVAAAALHRDRPLWISFGSCSVGEPLGDLTVLGMLPRTELV